MHFRLKPNELRVFIDNSRPKAAFVCEKQVEPFKALRRKGILNQIIGPKGDCDYSQLLERGTDLFRTLDLDRSETAVILYTGGTTGKPKGAMLSHENIWSTIQNVAFNERSTENDRALCFLPFHHVFGLMHIMNATILSGGCIELLPEFEMEEVLKILSKGKVTKLFAVPTIYVRFLALEDLKNKLGSVEVLFFRGCKYGRRSCPAVERAHGPFDS